MHDDPFSVLVERVGEFHLTDRAMKRAQTAIANAMKDGSPTSRDRAEYLKAVQRYFSGFEREAREHLRDVDKRLEHVNQVHFNLTAERAVAAARIEATRQVLAELERVGER